MASKSTITSNVLTSSVAKQILSQSSAKSTPTSTLNKKPKVVEKKTPIEILYSRRASIREQKRLLITQNLQFFPSRIFYAQMFILSLITIVVVTVQIAMLVERTPLSVVCIGFLAGIVYTLSIVSLYFLEKNRTTKDLTIALWLHLAGFFFSLALIIINSIDMAMFNVSCMLACATHSYQFLGLIMVIFGSIEMIDFSLFILIIDFLILKETRALNVYLEIKK